MTGLAIYIKRPRTQGAFAQLMPATAENVARTMREQRR